MIVYIRRSKKRPVHSLGLEYVYLRSIEIDRVAVSQQISKKIQPHLAWLLLQVYILVYERVLRVLKLVVNGHNYV